MLKVSGRRILMSGERTKGMLHSDPRTRVVQQGFEIKLGVNRLIKAIRTVEKRTNTPPIHITPEVLAKLSQDPIIQKELRHRKSMHDEIAHNREVRDSLKTDIQQLRNHPHSAKKQTTLKQMRAQLKQHRKILKHRKV